MADGLPHATTVEIDKYFIMSQFKSKPISDRANRNSLNQQRNKNRCTLKLVYNFQICNISKLWPGLAHWHYCLINNS